MNSPDFFKYVIYGDSVCANHKIKFNFNNTEYEMTLEDTWTFLRLSTTNKVHYLNDKEYIEFQYNIFKILTHSNKDIMWATPKYFMRHKIDKEVAVLQLKDDFDLYVTKDHSLFNENFEIKTPLDPALKFLPRIKKQNFIEKLFNKTKIEITPIINKRTENYNGYVYDFEVENTHNFIVDSIIVHNTDSLYINIPSLKPKTSEEAIESADKISNEINNLITNYMNSHLLKKLNVNPKYNRTSFKTELIAGSILLLDVKKYYAYRAICDNGKKIENPTIIYKGIPVIRTDSSKYAQNFLRSIIEEVALNEDPNLNMQLEYKKLLALKNQELRKAIDDFDIKYIGTPGKWRASEYKSEPYIMTAMRFYNSLTKTETFKDGLSCFTVPITLNAPAQIKNYISRLEYSKYYIDKNMDIKKISYIAFPYIFDKLKALKLMNEFNLSIDYEATRIKSFSTTCERVGEIIKMS